jgi:predicted helicase
MHKQLKTSVVRSFMRCTVYYLSKLIISCFEEWRILWTMEHTNSCITVVTAGTLNKEFCCKVVHPPSPGAVIHDEQGLFVT